MTQQEFEHIYSSIKAELTGLARGFCRSTSVDLDAEDIVQEAMIVFWELSRKDYPMSNPRALLVKITKNICISRYRKRRLPSEPLEGHDFLGGARATEMVEKADELIIKQRLYETLTRTERLYMLLRTDDGLSLDEMMLRTGGSRASVKTAMSKAKKKLEEQLKKMGYDR